MVGSRTEHGGYMIERTESPLIVSLDGGGAGA